MGPRRAWQPEWATSLPGGFTLIELLTVVGIIGILAAFLLSALSKSKEHAQGTQCMSNLRQMQTAWQLYADDASQILVPNVGLFRDDYVSNKCWVVGNVSGLPDETNRVLLSSALLGPYAKNVSVYKCPADPGNPIGTPRVRSISMNNYMHGIGMAQDEAFVRNVRMADIRQPAASFVFVDERSSTLDDGYFVMDLAIDDQVFSVNLPAVYHSLASALSFADGHAQLKKWKTPAFQNARDGQMPMAGNVDYAWLMQNTTVPISGGWPAMPP